ncbi:hypothetical protein BGW39_000854 [Mortierella sp. 14UC]|nr:hypothetical protein BGW39_000854 [Mortierella sp. 14UC]
MTSLDAPQEYPSNSNEDFTKTVMDALLGDKFAQNALGEMFKDGRGVLQDYEAAMDWFLKTADQGLARVQFNVGDLYDYGRGVSEDFLKRWTGSARLPLKATRTLNVLSAVST